MRFKDGAFRRLLILVLIKSVCTKPVVLGFLRPYDDSIANLTESGILVIARSKNFVTLQVSCKVRKVDLKRV